MFAIDEYRDSLDRAFAGTVFEICIDKIYIRNREGCSMDDSPGHLLVSGVSPVAVYVFCSRELN